MDIDNLVAEFGSKGATKTAVKPDGLDVDALVSEFGGKSSATPAAQSATGLPRVVIDTSPKVPISGVTAAESDALNARIPKQAKTNDNRVDNTGSDLIDWVKELPSNLKKSTGEALEASKALAGEGITDFSKGNKVSAALKVAGGALGAVTSPISGGLKELVEKPITTMTGNKKAGDIAGLIVGSAIPIVPGANKVSAAIPKNKAFASLVEDIGAENIAEVARRMRENPRLTPADLSPRVRQGTQHLFVTDGEHINKLDKVTKQRVEGAKGAVEGAIDDALGIPVDALKKLNKMKDAAREVGKKEINPAVTGAKPVDLTDAIAHIDAQMKPGVNSVISMGDQLPSPEIIKQLGNVRRMLTDGKSVRTDADTLHTFQSVLRTEADNLLNSADGQARRMGGALMTMRNKIVDAIDNASPQVIDATTGKASGSYKSSLAKYADEKHIEDAFRHGHDSILANSRKIEARPEFFKEWVGSAKPAELEAAREGARLAMDTQINGFKHAARRGTDIGEVEFNRQKITSLFGKEEADKMFKKLKDEREIADTNAKLTQGSQTAMRSATKEKFSLPVAGDVTKNALIGAGVETASAMAGGYPGLATLGMLALKGGSKVKHAIEDKLQRRHNAEYVDMALPSDATSRMALIRQLEAAAPKPKPSMLQRASNLSQLVAPP